MSKCKSEKLKKIKFGLCSQCEAHFRPFRINNPRYVEKYIAYKQAHGLGKVDASVIPISAIFTRFDTRLHGQSPMRAAPPHDSRQPSQKSFEETAPDSVSPDCETAGSNWSWSPAPAGSCVAEIVCFSDLTEFVDYGEADTVSQRKGRARPGAKMPGLYRGSGLKETTLYMPRDSVLEFDHRAPLLNACPRAAWWRCDRRSWSRYAKTWTPAKRPVVRSRSASWVPVPRSEHHGEIFLGCPAHGLSRRMGCTACRDNAFKEQGVPAAIDARLRRCQSAPRAWFASRSQARAIPALRRPSVSA